MHELQQGRQWVGHLVCSGRATHAQPCLGMLPCARSRSTAKSHSQQLTGLPPVERSACAAIFKGGGHGRAASQPACWRWHTGASPLVGVRFAQHAVGALVSCIRSSMPPRLCSLHCALSLSLWQHVVSSLRRSYSQPWDVMMADTCFNLFAELVQAVLATCALIQTPCFLLCAASMLQFLGG